MFEIALLFLLATTYGSFAYFVLCQWKVTFDAKRTTLTYSEEDSV